VTAGLGASQRLPLRAVIFDYGHTLVDFNVAEEALLDCYEQVRLLLLREVEQELPEARDLLTALSKPVDAMVQDSYAHSELEELDILELFQNALVNLGLSLRAELVAQIVEMEHRAAVSDLHVERENLAVLSSLRERGLKIGLVSNAHFLPRLMREDIERLGIAALLHAAVFSAEIGVRKPHPAIFRKVLDEIEVSPEEAIFVGDRLRDDVQGAKELGMPAVLTHQFRQEEVEGASQAPDALIERLPDLVPIVDRAMLAQAHF
jgi:HAD superfamily hydrolase (TIGR01509 family)